MVSDSANVMSSGMSFQVSELATRKARLATDITQEMSYTGDQEVKMPIFRE